MRAKRVDRNQADVVSALRAYGCVVQHLHTVGEGVPDLLVGHPHSRKLGLLEVKDGKKPPSARELTEAQVEFWERWSGFPIGLVTDVEGALRFARMLAFGDDK
jgi:hypothetical protein